MKTLVRLVLCLTLASAAALADSIIVGAPGDPFNGDCAPFGCALEYQQVYGAGQFPATPIIISGLTFFNANFVPGSIATANYTLSLSTTVAAVNGLSATFADNLGAYNEVFFSGALGGPIGPNNQFTLSGTPFAYDPAGGNLLLSVLKEGGDLDFSVFLDVVTNAPADTVSRAYSFDASGIAGTVENNAGLVTEFVTTPIPEPGTVWLVIVGIGMLVLRQLRKRLLGAKGGLRSGPIGP